MAQIGRLSNVFFGCRYLRRTAFVSVALLAGIAGPALALERVQPANGYIRTNFTVEDGLLSNTVNAVLQTRDGFLWTGTEDGLLRFDGRHFTAVEFLPQASPVSVSALAEAPDGALWVGTRGGVARIAAKALSQAGPESAILYHTGSGSSDSIQCIRFSRNGDLWVGTLTGLYRFERGGFSAVIPELWISRIEEASNGNLLVITSKGFVEWDGRQVIRHPDLPAKLGVAQNEIYHVFEDHAGTIWYCTTVGLARQVGGSIERLEPYGRDVVFRVNEDPQGTVWFSQSGGLYRATAAGRKLIATNLSAKYLAFDRDGDVWVGTKGTGLSRLKRQAVTMFTAADGLPIGAPTSVLAATDGKLWVGSDCGGLSGFDGRRFHTYSERDGLTNSCVSSLAEDHNHDILIGTFGGAVFRFREGRFTKIVPENTLKNNVTVALLPANDGSLWIPYSDGLIRIRDGQERRFTTADGLSSDSILSAYVDRRGVIWVETTAGIDRLEKDRFVAVSKTNNTTTGQGRFGFGEDQSGELFAFGPYTGIVQVHENRVVRVSGAPKITGMLTSRENLWFCGDGIYRAAPDSLRRWEYEPDTPPDYARFDRADGMESADCSGGFRNMAITSDGKLWVATPQGVAMLDVPRLPNTDEKIATYIEKIVIGKTPEPVGRELIVKPGTRHVELHFDAIEVSSPERIRLQYRLDDVDREWLDATATASAIYTGFPIGTHKFHVRASNRDGVWDRAGIVYNITQQPYFYQTSWFAGACVMALIGILGISHRFRLQYVTSRIQERLEERASERVRIARELHDTLLQSFHGLLLRFQAAHNLLPGRVVDAMQVLEAAIDNAAQAITEARDAVQDLRSSTIVTNDLAKAIEVLGGELRAHQRAADGDSSDFSVQVEGTPLDLNPILRDGIYRIAGEAFRNAFHHARARRIEVEIRYGDRHFSVRVRDDGIGIDASVLSQEGRPGHFGLRGMRERSKSIGGQLEVWSEHGAGTEMELTIPATIAYGDHVARRLRLFKSKMRANS